MYAITISKKRLAWALGLLFGAPLLLVVVIIIAGFFDREIPGDKAIIDKVLYWFYPPAALFGTTHFDTDKLKYLPKDMVGLLLSIGIYLMVSLIVSTKVLRTREQRKRSPRGPRGPASEINSAEQAGAGYPPQSVGSPDP